MCQPSRKPPRRRPADAWAAIRRDYASGVPARVAAERGGVSLSTLRTRARREGWRREDGCGPPQPADWSPDLEHVLEADPALLAEEAWLNAARFTRLGRLSEAAAWARMAAHCRRAARDADKENSAMLSALNGAVRVLGRPLGRMHTADGERMLLMTFGKMLEAVAEVSGAPADFAAPECKSQAVEPAPVSAEFHPLHTPKPQAAGAPSAEAPPTPSAHPRASGDPGVLQPSDAPSAQPGSDPPADAGATEKAWVPASAGMSGAESEGADPPPWAALHARPEADLSWNEAALLRRVREHGLDALFAQNRPAAEGRWAGWLRRFPLDPDPPPPGPPPACVSHSPHLHRGPRVALL